MFSYRHAFHAGNHADVLKHLALIGVMRHMTQKDAALTVVDTHAGAGLYRLDSDYSVKGAEACDGVLKLLAAWPATPGQQGAVASPLLLDYLDLVRGFNSAGALKIYPGSPFVLQRLLRNAARDRLRLFETHPSDGKTLLAHVAQLAARRQVTAAREDGFEALKGLLPPPSRRALVLIDPSYEIKSDYAKVASCMQDSLRRFATGTYVVWYPVIPRPEAHDLPRRLKTLATQAQRPWLHATLAIGQAPTDPGQEPSRPGLTASGLFIVNPPHTLKALLDQALPQVLQALGRGRGAVYAVLAGA